MSEQTDPILPFADRFARLRYRLRQLFGWIDGALPWRALVLVILLGALLHVFGIVSLPFWPFTTSGGSIYVDSPEVYTRERLVNDRYEQDYWLRDQLRQLNELTPEDLASGWLSTKTGTEIGEPRPVAADGDGAAGGGERDEREKLDPRDSFQVLSGLRDMLRQQILENMLDDRHDLTANSVYGLKFDTTVIPGHNTRHRAFVEVEVKPVDLFLREEHAPPTAKGLLARLFRGDDAQGARVGMLAELDNYQRAFLCKQARLKQWRIAGCEGVEPVLADYEAQRQLYDAWLQDIAKRLNSAEASLFKSIAAREDACPDVPVGIAAERYAELISKSLEVVLNLPQKRFIIDHEDRYRLRAKRPASVASSAPGDVAPAGADYDLAPTGRHQIRLPEPYSDYMQITARPIWERGEVRCPLRVAFVVEPVRERYTVCRASVDAPRLALRVAESELITSTDLARYGDLLEVAQSLPGAALAVELPCDWDLSLLPFWRTADGAWQLYMDPVTWEIRTSVASDFGVVYEVPGALLDALAKYGLVEDVVLSGEARASVARFGIDLPSGFFNFIDSMRELDAYAYAVFPKNDVRGLLRESEYAGGAGSAAGGLGFLQRLTESRTEPLLVGYGDARETDAGEAAVRPPRAVRFGWVIDSPGKMQPSLKTQLALVSVPAWTDRLTITVTTGWLDRAGRRIGEPREVQMDAKLPPDYGAFDSIFRDQGWVTPAPQIQDQQMDEAIYVVASQDASILIPGLRLWRSTSVTLGSQLADRIRVLPNMEGIIAEFRPVRLPFAKYKPRLADEGDVVVGDGPVASPKCTLRERNADGTLGEKMDAFRDLDVRPVRLRVWTSEGVAVAHQHACVVYDPARQVREAMTKPPEPGSSAWLSISAGKATQPGGDESGLEVDGVVPEGQASRPPEDELQLDR